MSNHLGKTPDNPRPAPTHGATRRTSLATGSVAAGAVAGGALAPGRAFASSGDASSVEPADWPDGPGRLNRPQTAAATLRGILRDIDPDRIQNTIETLVGFGTRHTLSTQSDPNRGIGAARDWIKAQMDEFASASGGRMTTEIQSYIQPVGVRVDVPTQISNVIATLKGSREPDRIYVISGHY